MGVSQNSSGNLLCRRVEKCNLFNGDCLYLIKQLTAVEHLLYPAFVWSREQLSSLLLSPLFSSPFLSYPVKETVTFGAVILG